MYKFTITPAMVLNPLLLGDKLFPLLEAIGTLQRHDIGRKVYEVNGVYKVENDQQRKNRLVN